MKFNLVPTVNNPDLFYLRIDKTEPIKSFNGTTTVTPEQITDYIQTMCESRLVLRISSEFCEDAKMMVIGYQKKIKSPPGKVDIIKKFIQNHSIHIPLKDIFDCGIVEITGLTKPISDIEMTALVTVTSHDMVVYLNFNVKEKSE